MTSPAPPPAAEPSLADRRAALGTTTLIALLLNIACVTTAEILLRTGASAAPTTSIFGLAALRDPATMIGICFHVAAFVLWMYALRTVPLTLAYNFTAVNQALVPIAAWLLLPNENISLTRWAGIALVLCGFILLVPILARVEHEPVAAPHPSTPEVAP